jgi:hypothetical protein
MTPREHTALLLRQWHQLTRAESGAIQAAAWPKLRDIQSRKAALMQPLSDAFARWNSAEPAVSGDAGSNPFRAGIARLIALESHNAQLLAGRRDAARQQQLHLDRAAQNLRNVRRTYVPPLPPVACNSYS